MKHIPNILSAIRILLVPVFVIFFFGQSENAHFHAAMIYFIAVATDILDGLIARKFHVISDLGRILDPLGDKLMSLAMLTCLTISALLPFKVLLFFAIKDLILIIGGIFIHQKLHSDMPAANYLGKASSCMLFITGMLLMLFKIPKTIFTVMIYSSIFIAFMALVSYISIFYSVLKSNNNGSGTTGE